MKTVYEIIDCKKWVMRAMPVTAYEVSRTLQDEGYNDTNPFFNWVTRLPMDALNLRFTDKQGGFNCTADNLWQYHISYLSYMPFYTPPASPTAKVCDCGAKHTREPHYDWCSTQ